MTDPFSLDRRSMMARAFALVGAGAAASMVSLPAFAALAGDGKTYLDKARFAALTAVADTIVPRTATAGAVDAKVPALLDTMLAEWASPTRREQISAGLDEIDGLARTAHGKNFVSLTAEERLALLRKHEETALNVDPSKPATGIRALTAGPAYLNPGYGKLKELVVLLYYLSEPALTQELSYVHSPGDWQPSIPVTPETRPAAGGIF